MKSFNITYNITFKSGHIMNNQIIGVYAENEAEALDDFNKRGWLNSTDHVEFVSIHEKPMTHLDRDFLRGTLSTVGD